MELYIKALQRDFERMQKASAQSGEAAVAAAVANPTTGEAMNPTAHMRRDVARESARERGEGDSRAAVVVDPVRPQVVPFDRIRHLPDIGGGSGRY